MRMVTHDVIECSNCGSRGRVEPSAAIAGGAGAGFVAQADGHSEAPGTLRLVKGNTTRSVEEIRRDLLEAHRQHIAASELEEHARKAHQSAAHNTVDKLGRITQLRNELVQHVERPNAQELAG